MGQVLKRSPSKMYMQESPKEQMSNNGYILNHQGSMHQDYGYSTCVNASGKVQVTEIVMPFTIDSNATFT